MTKPGGGGERFRRGPEPPRHLHQPRAPPGGETQSEERDPRDRGSPHGERQQDERGGEDDGVERTDQGGGGGQTAGGELVVPSLAKREPPAEDGGRRDGDDRDPEVRHQLRSVEQDRPRASQQDRGRHRTEADHGRPHAERPGQRHRRRHGEEDTELQERPAELQYGESEERDPARSGRHERQSLGTGRHL